MANYFYVKSGGSLGVNDDTSYSSMQTGSFPSSANCYDSVAAACSDGTKINPASDGDFVLVSDTHSKDHDFGSKYIMNASGSIGGAGLVVMSVDDTACDTYKPGAHETLNDGADEIELDYNGVLAGFSGFGTADDGIDAGFSSREWILYDTTFLAGNQTTDFAIGSMDADGMYWKFYNCWLDWNGGSNAISSLIRIVSNCAIVEFYGGGFKSTGGGTCNYLTISNAGANGGGFLSFYGSDLSLITSSLTYGYGSLSDNFHVKLVGCKINSGLTLATNLSASCPPTVSLELINTDDATNSRQHRWRRTTFAGTVLTNDSIYVTNTTDWYEGSTGSSFEVITGSACSELHPLEWTYNQYIDLSSASSNRVIVNLTSAVTLTDKDVAAFLVYQDGTDYEVGTLIGTYPSPSGYLGIDALDSGTTLTNPGGLGSGDWTGGKTNYYSIALDTSGDAGAGQFVTVKIKFMKASVATGNVYFDSELAYD